MKFTFLAEFIIKTIAFTYCSLRNLVGGRGSVDFSNFYVSDHVLTSGKCPTFWNTYLYFFFFKMKWKTILENAKKILLCFFETLQNGRSLKYGGGIWYSKQNAFHTFDINDNTQYILNTYFLSNLFFAHIFTCPRLTVLVWIQL